MWLFLLHILPARPLARALIRFRRGPSLAYISTIRRSDRRQSCSFSPLAEADLTTLATCAATGEGMNLRICKASSTRLPRTRSAIGFTFFGDMPVFFAVALTANLFYPTGPRLLPWWCARTLLNAP